MRSAHVSEVLDPLLDPTVPVATAVAVPPTIPTGLTDLDSLTGGLRGGDLWVVTGRSGAGKSVLALDFVRSAAIRSKVRTVHVRAREQAEDLAAQIVSAEGRIPLHHLRASLTDDERARAASVMAQLAHTPLWMIATVNYGETGMPEARQQVAAATAVLEKQGPGLLVVDDLPASITGAQLQELKALAVQGRTCVIAVVLDGTERTRDAGCGRAGRRRRRRRRPARRPGPRHDPGK